MSASFCSLLAVALLSLPAAAQSARMPLLPEPVEEPSPAHAVGSESLSIFLQIPKIEGDVKLQHYNKWIEVESYAVELFEAGPGTVVSRASLEIRDALAFVPLVSRALTKPNLPLIELAWVDDGGGSGPDERLRGKIDGATIDGLSLVMENERPLISLSFSFESSSWVGTKPSPESSVAAASAGSSNTLLVKLPDVKGGSEIQEYKDWIEAKGVQLSFDLSGPIPQISPLSMSMPLTTAWPTLVEQMTDRVLLRDVMVEVVSNGGDGVKTLFWLTLTESHYNHLAVAGQFEDEVFASITPMKQLRWGQISYAPDGQSESKQESCFDLVKGKLCH